MRILIVEDEEKSAAFLRKGLAESGFVVDAVGTGEEGRFRARRSTRWGSRVVPWRLPKRACA